MNETQLEDVVVLHLRTHFLSDPIANREIDAALAGEEWGKTALGRRIFSEMSYDTRFRELMETLAGLAKEGSR